MKTTFEVIRIPKNTYGTKLEFELYDSNNNDEALSAYTSIVLRAFNIRDEEAFFGNVDESLSGALNKVHYTFKQGDLGLKGMYKLFLDLYKVNYKNTIDAGVIKVY